MRTIKASEPAARLIPRIVSWRSGHGTALTVSGYGVRFFVDRGRLVIEDGFASAGTRRRTIFSRGTYTLQRIIVVGRTGLITLDALQWLADLGTAVLFVGVGGHVTSVFTPGGLEGGKTRLHRVQATARTSEVGVRVAQLLIGHKLLGQAQVLEWLAAPGRQVPLAARRDYERVGRAAAQLRALCDRGIQHPRHLEDIIETERAGGQIYWAALSGIPLRWKPRIVERVPEHWLATQPRESFRTGNRYGATDPTNALLNYGYALLEAETRIACHNAGIHQGLGIIHADRDGRESFVYDLMEPVRPIVDRMVLGFVRRHTFGEHDCIEVREGYCRLDPDLIALTMPWVARLKVAVTSIVREVTHELAHITGRPST